MTNTKRAYNDGSSDTINIHLRPGESNSDDVEEKSSTQYIISQNRRIAHENKLLIIDKVSLEKELDEKDDELGRTEKSNVHLKGLLKNFKELSDLNSQISSSHQVILKDNQTDIFYFQQHIIQIRNILSIIYGIYMLLMFFIMSFSSFIIMNISIFPLISILYVCNFKSSSSKIILDDIRVKRRMIREIEDSLDYINEYIDSI